MQLPIGEPMARECACNTHVNVLHYRIHTHTQTRTNEAKFGQLRAQISASAIVVAAAARTLPAMGAMCVCVQHTKRSTRLSGAVEIARANATCVMQWSAVVVLLAAGVWSQ